MGEGEWGWVVKWDCWYRRGHQYPGAYRGHVLAPVGSGWYCVHCALNFNSAAEDSAFRVVTEELPTEGADYAAVTLALCASNQEGETAGDVWRVADDVAWIMGHGALGLVGGPLSSEPAENSAEERAAMFAEGEAVFRNGEV